MRQKKDPEVYIFLFLNTPCPPSLYLLKVDLESSLSFGIYFQISLFSYGDSFALGIQRVI